MRWSIVVVITLVTQTARAECVEEARELRAHLTRESRNAGTWNTAWAIGFGAAAAGQLGLVAAQLNPIGTYDDAFKEQMYVGASKATLGLAVRVVLPLKIHVPPPDADACVDVKQLREAIAHAGKKEKRSVILTLLGGTAVNLAGSTLLFYRHDFKTAASSFVTGAIVGPISAFTQPRRSWKLSKHRRVEWQAAIGVGSFWVAGTF